MMMTNNENESLEDAEVAASEAFRVLRPREYYRRFLKRGVRPDGRGLDDSRPLTVTTGEVETADGSATVKLGGTTVIAGVTYEVAEPTSSAPSDGFVDIRVHIGPMCSDSPALRSGSAKMTSDEAHCVAEYLKRAIQSSNCVDNLDLCIHPGKAVWVLRAELICLNHDGNVWDAAMVALMAALRDAKLPSNVELSKDGEVVIVGDDISRKVVFNTILTPLTFALYGKDAIIDPTAEEETTCDGILTVVCNGKGEACTIRKPGGAPLTRSQIKACVKMCAARAAKNALHRP